MKFQLVEKDDYGTDWAAIRYSDRGLDVLQRFDTEEDAIKIAKKYLTERNCDNALTKEEKLNSVEAFIMTKEGCFLGVLDGADWYLTYPKDIVGKGGNHVKGDIVQDLKFFMLEGKTQVAVRPLPGT